MTPLGDGLRLPVGILDDLLAVRRGENGRIIRVRTVDLPTQGDQLVRPGARAEAHAIG